MKKLILSLLTIASFTACKKDIVEPVEENITLSEKLPTKVIKRDGYHTYVLNYLYNNDGLVSQITQYDSLHPTQNQIIIFSYQGSKLSTKVTTNNVTGTTISETFKYVNNRISEYGFGNESYKCTYDNLGNLISINDIQKQKDVDLKVVTLVSDSLRYEDTYGGFSLKYLDKQIEFQKEVAKSFLQIGERANTDFLQELVMENKRPLKYCSQFTTYWTLSILNYTYKFDSNDRLIDIWVVPTENADSFLKSHISIYY